MNFWEELECFVNEENTSPFFLQHLHKKDPVPPLTKVYKIYECKLCGKKSKNISAHNVHLNTHSKKKNYKCRYCEAVYTSQSSKYDCERYHFPTTYPCKYCGKEYTTHGGVQYHVRRNHTLERPYMCRYCIRSFHGASARNVHEKYCKNRH